MPSLGNPGTELPQGPRFSASTEALPLNASMEVSDWLPTVLAYFCTFGCDTRMVLPNQTNIRADFVVHRSHQRLSFPDTETDASIGSDQPHR